MAIFEVYVPEKPSGDPSIRMEQVRFVKDRVSVFALLLPAFWMIWNRLWFALMVYVIFSLALAGLGNTDYAPVVLALSFLPGLYCFLEGSNLVAAKLVSRGYHFIDIVEAANIKDAETRWFLRQKVQSIGVGQIERPAVTAKPSPIGPMAGEHAEFGLFAEE